MKLAAILPVKPLTESKSRLAPVLSSTGRACLVRGLLQRTLATLQTVQAIHSVLVISRDETLLRLARRRGAEPLREQGPVAPSPDAQLNAALVQAIQAAQAAGAQGVLILPVDLPLLTPADVGALLEEVGPGPGMVIAPSPSGGTNALLLVPPHAAPPAFGPGSFARHLARAQAQKVPVRVLTTPGLAFDLDTPADWRTWLEAGKSRALDRG